MKAFDNYVNAIAIELSEVYWHNVKGSYCYKLKHEDDPTFNEWLISEGLAFEMKSEDYVAIDHKKAVKYLLEDLYKHKSQLYDYPESMTFEKFLNDSGVLYENEINEQKAIEFIIDSSAISSNEPVAKFREQWREWWGV